MKTHVHVGFSCFSHEFIFDMDIEEFDQKWKKQLAGVGYFSCLDANFQLVIINPSNCGIIKINEAD
jgi:hypothetical protein